MVKSERVGALGMRGSVETLAASSSKTFKDISGRTSKEDDGWLAAPIDAEIISYIKKKIFADRPLYCELSKQDFESMLLKAVGPANICRSSVDIMFTDCDTNEDGWLGVEELTSYFQQLQPSTRWQQVFFALSRMLTSFSFWGLFLFMAGSTISATNNLLGRKGNFEKFGVIAIALVVWSFLVGSILLLFVSIYEVRRLEAATQQESQDLAIYMGDEPNKTLHHQRSTAANLKGFLRKNWNSGKQSLSTLHQQINAVWLLGSLLYLIGAYSEKMGIGSHSESHLFGFGGVFYFLGGVLSMIMTYVENVSMVVNTHALHLQMYDVLTFNELENSRRLSSHANCYMSSRYVEPSIFGSDLPDEEDVLSDVFNVSFLTLGGNENKKIAFIDGDKPTLYIDSTEEPQLTGRSQRGIGSILDTSGRPPIELSDMIDSVIKYGSEKNPDALASRRLLHLMGKMVKEEDESCSPKHGSLRTKRFLFQLPRSINSEKKPASIRHSQRMSLAFVEILQQRSKQHLTAELEISQSSTSLQSNFRASNRIQRHESSVSILSLSSAPSLAKLSKAAVPEQTETYFVDQPDISGLEIDVPVDNGRHCRIRNVSVEEEQGGGQWQEVSDVRTECHELYVALCKQKMEVDLDAFIGVFQALSSKDKVHPQSQPSLSNAEFFAFIDGICQERNSRSLNLVVLRGLCRQIGFWIGAMYIAAGIMLTLGAYGNDIGFPRQITINLNLVGSSIYVMGSIYFLYQSWRKERVHFRKLEACCMALKKEILRAF